MHIFDHTIKPVLLYASEIVGLFNNNKNVGVNSNNDSHFISNLYSRNPLEKLNISMGKYVLGVNKRTTNLAIYGELGRYPLYIDTIISMIKYWVRLCKNTHHDPLLREAYEDNLLMYGNNEPCWLRCIPILLKHLNMDHMLTHPENFKSRHKYSIKKKLQNNYETYRKLKFIFRYETYISDIRNISHRNILTRLVSELMWLLLVFMMPYLHNLCIIILNRRHLVKFAHLHFLYLSLCRRAQFLLSQQHTFLYPCSPKGEGVYCVTSVRLSVLPSVQDIFRRIFLSNC